MNKTTQLLMLAGAMGFLPKAMHTTSKEPQSEEAKQEALAKAQAKRDRKARKNGR